MKVLQKTGKLKLKRWHTIKLMYVPLHMCAAEASFSFFIKQPATAAEETDEKDSEAEKEGKTE